MCRSFDEGGLDIRNLRDFNYALLGKWEWKINFDRKGLWYKVLVNRYNMREDGTMSRGRDCSSWWNCILHLNIGEWYHESNYLVKEVYKGLLSQSVNPANPDRARHGIKLSH